MDIRPKYESNTIRINLTPIKMEKIESKTKVDPSGTIPNGIFKVIRWEKIRQLITICITASLTFAMALLMFIHAIWFPMNWAGYIIPSIIGLLSGWKLFDTLMERSSINKGLARYKEELEIGMGSSYPVFIVKIYEKLHRKQYLHNWLTFFFLFYVGLFTLLLWWLKDIHWWIFNFESWIKGMFHDPKLMAIIFSISLASVAVLHVIMAIQRKRRVIEIDAFFGQQVIPSSEIEEIRKNANKFWWRVFFLSVITILIIPVVVRLILKVLRRK